MTAATKKHEQLAAEIAELRCRLAEAEETLHAIRQGEVDALVVNERRGEKVYTLKSADRSYRLLIQEMQQGAASLTTDGVVLFCNRSFARLLNAPLDTVTGSSVLTCVASESRPVLAALLRQARDGGSSQGEVVTRGEPGVPLFFALSSLVLDDVFTLYAVATDLTDQKRMEELAAHIAERKRAEENLRLLADAGAMPTESLDLAATLRNSARLAVSGFADWCVIDLRAEDGRVERAIAAHADGSRQELVEELRRFPLRGDEPYGAAQVLRTGQSQNVSPVTPERLDAVCQSPEHRRLLTALDPRSALIVPLVARGRSLGAWSFFGSSDRCFDEGDLALAEELARRAALAIDNARLYAAAQAANLAKDQFLATLSHELRTPLTPVMAVISSLEHDARLPAPVQESLAMVRRNVELEARLIDDLLDSTRIARGKLELRRRRTHLHQVLEQAIETCCSESLASGRLRVIKDLASPDATLWADAPRLAQVFWNLLNNAVKFTPEGGTVTVRSWIEAPSPETTPAGVEAGEVVVQISDTGVGIPPEALGHIFNAFEQGDLSTTRRFGGLGLGLAISKAIVELHGGKLSAESSGTGHGATFTVRLPRNWRRSEIPEAATAPFQERRSVAKGEEGHPLHILLVEDHADTAEALAALLDGLGHRITVAGTVGDALAAADQVAGAADDTIDLVISDLGLPDGSGLDLMRELSGRYHLKGIALSGYGMEEDIRQSRQAGFTKHLTKPVTLDFLKDVIDQVCGQEGSGA